MISNKKYMSIEMDVCKCKWVAAALTEKGFEVNKFNSIEEICSKIKEVDEFLNNNPKWKNKLFEMESIKYYAVF